MKQMGERRAGNLHAAFDVAGAWKRGTVEIVGHSQTKGRDNREPKLRPKPARQSSTLLVCLVLAEFVFDTHLPLMSVCPPWTILISHTVAFCKCLNEAPSGAM